MAGTQKGRKKIPSNIFLIFLVIGLMTLAFSPVLSSTFATANNNLSDNTTPTATPTVTPTATEAATVTETAIEAATVTETATATPTDISTSTPTTSNIIIYYASSKSDVFHIAGCRYIKQIKANDRITFNSIKEAEDDGYRPCKVCLPELYEAYIANAIITPTATPTTPTATPTATETSTVSTVPTATEAATVPTATEAATVTETATEAATVTETAIEAATVTETATPTPITTNNTTTNTTNSDSSSSGSSGSNGDSSSSASISSDSSSSGTGGSPEPQSNVKAKELSQVYIGSGQSVNFDFPQKVTPVVNISFDSLKTAGKITTIVEMLNDQSTLVSNSPSDELYKYFNIWVGTGGFGDSNNFANPSIDFRVEKSWIQNKNIDKSLVTLDRYSDNKWDQLPTTLFGEDDTYYYYTAKTPGFSPFAIIGKSAPITSITPITPITPINTQSSPNIMSLEQNNSTIANNGVKSPGFESIYGILSLFAVFLYKKVK
jgi:PGF-pre-PGF domain-containing protein